MELDFYLPEQKKGIQGCYSLNDVATLEREIKALTTFHKIYGLKSAEIITYSEERTIETPDLTIHVRPLSEWVLSF